MNKTLKAHRNVFSCVYTIKRHERQRQSVGSQSQWVYFQSYTDLYSRLHVTVPCVFTLPHWAQSRRPTCKHMITPRLSLTTGKMWTPSPWRRSIISLRHCLLFILLPSASHRSVHYLWKPQGKPIMQEWVIILWCACVLFMDVKECTLNNFF